MKQIALVLLIYLGSAVYSQEQVPQLLTHAVQCLAVKNSFPRSQVKELTFGYLVDENSYPGEKVLYVVNYTAPAKSNGLAFAIYLTQHGDHQVFNIQNNASFVLSKHDIHGVSFVSPPLGGPWTQERLASAVERIEKRPRFTIPVRDIVVADASTDCESYTDPQPKPATK
jgi:hypothetical protein